MVRVRVRVSYAAGVSASRSTEVLLYCPSLSRSRLRSSLATVSGGTTVSIVRKTMDPDGPALSTTGTYVGSAAQQGPTRTAPSGLDQHQRMPPRVGGPASANWPGTLAGIRERLQRLAGQN